MKTSRFPFGRSAQPICWLGLAVVWALAGCATPDSKESKSMKLEQKRFGQMPDGTEVLIYTLSNKHGMVAKVTEYGALLTELWVPDRAGKLGDVVLGFDNLDRYLQGHPFFGATAKRVANRI